LKLEHKGIIRIAVWNKFYIKCSAKLQCSKYTAISYNNSIVIKLIKYSICSPKQVTFSKKNKYVNNKSLWAKTDNWKSPLINLINICRPDHESQSTYESQKLPRIYNMMNSYSCVFSSLSQNFDISSAQIFRRKFFYVLWNKLCKLRVPFLDMYVI